MENTTHAASIAATLDLTNDVHRELCDAIRRMHTGRRSLFRRMHDIQRVGENLVELAEWRGGGYAVVWWSLTRIGMCWQHHKSFSAARTAFYAVA